MNGKDYVFKLLESALKQKNYDLKDCQESIKHMKEVIITRNSRALEIINDICALEAAIERLKDKSIIASWEKTMQDFEEARKAEEATK